MANTYCLDTWCLHIKIPLAVVFYVVEILGQCTVLNITVTHGILQIHAPKVYIPQVSGNVMERDKGYFY